MKLHCTCIAFILFLAAQSAIAQTSSSSKQKAASSTVNAAIFEQYIIQALPLWKTPGMSVVVVKDNAVVFRKGFGVTELGKPAPFSTSTMSICASTTKAMTAVCLGMLVDEGKLKWDDKISDVYPDLKLYDDYVSSQVTVRDLLTHNAGLGNADWLWTLGKSTDSIIHQMRYMKPAYSFRSSFIYQNLMYAVAGEVIHKVSGKPWDVFIKERLFSVLKMAHTYPVYEQSRNEPSHITPHFIKEDSSVKPIPFIDIKGINAAGAVWSCADDMDKWLSFLLDSAKANGQRLLKAETFAELFKPQVMVTPDQFYPTAALTHPHWTTYGLGWFQEDYRGKMVQFHTGSLDGAVAILGLIPDEHFGIYIFANLDHTELRHALMYKAMDLWCFGDKTSDWSGSFFKMYSDKNREAKKKEADEEAKRVLNTHPSLSLSAYSGKYENEIFGDAEISVTGDSLLLQFPNHINLHLSHWNYDTFMGKFERDWYGKSVVQFSLDPTVKVSQFTIDGMVYTRK